MQEREHPYTGHFYQTWPVDKDNVTVGSVDVLITSPPYNLGTKTGDSGSAILNDQAFFELLKSVFVHGEKLLKDGGILVFDIALWIRKEHGTGDKWEARDACLTWAKKASLQLLSDFKYSLLDLTKSGQTHSGDDGMHSDEQHILVFGKKNQSQLLSLPPCDPDNPLFPFPKSYRSDAEFRPEPFWPLELVRDLVSVFQLDRKNICVLDPFMGSGQIGLHVARHGGVFIGFEVQNNLREELEKIWDFEFSVEEAQAKRDLEKTETKKNFWPSYIKYAGLTLIDHLSKISRLPTGVFIDKKYLKAVKEKAIFEALEHTKTSLAAILIKNGIAEDVQLQSGSDGRILSFPGRIAPENIPENRINNEWNLLEQEKSALDLNFQFLEIEAHRANMWFLPIKIPRGHGSDVFSYLVLVLSGTAQLPLYERNRLMAHIRRLLADVLLRRAEVYAQLSYAEQERSARVAVFARNFSHIIGSHVISNPEFKAALVGDKVLSGIRQQLDRAHGDFIRAENDYLRDGIDMDTEALWREGTKVLEGMRQG
ncbi:MAG: DNA methyltransferase, partial [Verrucomicrobiota bacterium]